MQYVNTLPVFISQDADFKSKNLTEPLTDSTDESSFSVLVEEHIVDENKGSEKALLEQQGSAATDNDALATDEILAVNKTSNKSDLDTRQENGAENEVDVDKHNKLFVNGEDLDKRESDNDNESDIKIETLEASEHFISLLYKSDHTLISQHDKNNLTTQDTSTNTLKNKDHEIVSNKISNDKHDTSEYEKTGRLAPESEHKLSAFSKELLPEADKFNSRFVLSPSNSQPLKDSQLSLQASNNRVKNQLITHEGQQSVQINPTLLNNKSNELAVDILPVNQQKLIDKLAKEVYQLPVEPIKPIGNEEAIEDDSFQLMKEVKSKNIASQEVNKSISPVKVQAETNVETSHGIKSQQPKVDENLSTVFIDKLNHVPSDNKIASDKQSNLSLAQISQGEKPVEDLIKKEMSTTQNQQVVISKNSVSDFKQIPISQSSELEQNDQQVIDKVSEELIESSQVVGDKPIENDIKISNKSIDTVKVNSLSHLNEHNIQATQIKQSNDAYFEHEVSEVLKHNVASDTAQIQKNNVQLQQEVISIFRKDFAEAVKDKIMITINQKLQQFDISLDPPEFGNMQVRVNLQGEQASVNFSVQNQQAKDALEQNMHKLRDMLSEQGVDVGGANVEQQNQQNQQGQQNEQIVEQQNRKSSIVNSGSIEGDITQTLSAKLFDTSTTAVDYYA